MFQCMHACAAAGAARHDGAAHAHARTTLSPAPPPQQTLPVQLLTMMGGRCVEGALLEGASEASCAGADAARGESFLELPRHLTAAAAAPAALCRRRAHAGVVGCCQCSDPVNDMRGWCVLRSAKKEKSARDCKSDGGDGFVCVVCLPAAAA